MAPRLGIAALFMAAVVSAGSGSSLPTTAPAFLWSQEKISGDDVKDLVYYQTISSNDLAKSVLEKGGWSNILCSGKKVQDTVDIAVVFIGKKLQSSDISKNNQDDPGLIDMLKLSFANSKESIAFPYVAISDGEVSGNLLLSTFTEACPEGLVETKKFYDLNSVENYVSSKMESTSRGQTELLVYISDVKSSADVKSEGEILFELVDILKKFGTRYSVLYASEPYTPDHRLGLPIERLLLDTIDASNSTTCDQVCQIKASLVEGAFVGLVLLIILISGLMCMMGISTPAKFETPPES